MSTVIACPTCRTPLAAPPEMAGQTVACPRCQQMILLAGPSKPVYPTMPAAPAAGPPARPAAAARSAPRAKPFPWPAVVSWAAMLACLIVPAVILWRLRAAHLANPPAAVAKNRAESPPPPPSSVRAAGVVTAPAATPLQPPPLTPRAPIGKSLPTQTALPHAPPAARVQPSPTAPAAPSQATAPAPPHPAETLATLGEAWQLPALISTANEAMGKLAGPPTEPLMLALRSPAADLPPEAAIYAQAAGEPGVWSVLYVEDVSAPANPTPLATIRLEGEQLGFAWTSATENAELRRQVANCQLLVRCGPSVRLIQLRVPLAQAACKLDLSQDVQKLEFQLPDLPKTELVRLELTGLDDFPGGAQAKSDSLAIGQETLIEFSEPAGAQIEIRFRQLTGGQLTVQLEPVFKENGSRTFDMTLPRLDAMEEGTTKALRADERDLPIQQNRLKAQQAALRKLQGAKPSNPLLLPAWRGSIQSQEGDIKRTANRIVSLQKQIVAGQARLAAVPPIRSFLLSLHQRAAIRMRVVAECDDGQIVLVRAEGK